MRLPLLLLAASLASASAEAEIAVMSSGKILYVDRFERVDDRITLFVTGGGVVTVPSTIVLNVVPNEIVEKGEDPQRVSLFPQLEEYIAHRRLRERQILDALGAGCARVAEIVKRVYAAYPESLHAAAGASVSAHLLKLEREGRVRRDAAEDPLAARWAPA